MVFWEEYDIQSENMLILIIYVCHCKTYNFKLFIAAAEIAAAHRTIFHDTFSQNSFSWTEFSNGFEKLKLFFEHVFFHIAYNVGYCFQTEEQSVYVMSSVRNCFVLWQKEKILFKLYCLGYYSSLTCWHVLK